MTDRPTVTLLTGANYPDLARDDLVLKAAFDADGWHTQVVQWRAPAPSADLALIRSCWDYRPEPDAFRAALARHDTTAPLVNPLGTVEWNLDKRYLLELASAGAPVPPTRVVPRGTAPALASLLADLEADEVVVKPVVGAGGEQTWRFRAGDAAHWEAVAGSEDFLVQPFLPEVVTEGEVSLVFLHGSYAHAVVKRARDGEFRVQEEHGGTVAPWDAPRAVRAAAELVLAATPHPWRYARVDGIVTAAGFRLMELELVEPELFFRAAAGSAAGFVAGFRSILA